MTLTHNGTKCMAIQSVEFRGRTYHVNVVDGAIAWIEVRIPAGEPRVMRDARPAMWRALNPTGPKAKLIASIIKK